ncbi:hypothetical protein M0P48_03395 [Candidatus Gracilibacteria bacterium]|nr:hypothetical protein [Candidatus Gracilibacteria bacterium]
MAKGETPKGLSGKMSIMGLAMTAMAGCGGADVNFASCEFALERNETVLDDLNGEIDYGLLTTRESINSAYNKAREAGAFTRELCGDPGAMLDENMRGYPAWGQKLLAKRFELQSREIDTDSRITRLRSEELEAFTKTLKSFNEEGTTR